jgi:hypothetical protein
MRRANWPEQGSNSPRHRLPGTHPEQVLQPMQLPWHLKHLSDMLAYARLLLFDDEAAHTVTT